MTYTKEFEEWVEKAKGPGSGSMGIIDRGVDDMAHFWLSAFVKLVREEAAKLALQACHGVPHTPIDDDYGEALNSICERFGLEKK